MDPGGEILECNPAARELLGEPLIGESFAGVLGRAASGVSGVAEHTELSTGSFVNISRRELENGGEVVLQLWPTRQHPGVHDEALVVADDQVVREMRMVRGAPHHHAAPLNTAAKPVNAGRELARDRGLGA